MRLPDFLCIGAMRCGTTTLWDFLSVMPDIYLPNQKELHFFDNRDHQYEKGLSFYSSYFAEAQSEQVCGEITPIYLFLEECCSRIQKTLPGVKFIVILRNPVARAWSHYRYSVLYGPEHLSFKEALAVEEERLASGSYKNLVYFSYRKRGEYIQQLIRYEKAFSREKICVVFLEDLKRNPELVINQIRHHLGLSPLANFDFNSIQKKNELKQFPSSVALYKMGQRMSRKSGTSFFSRGSRKLGQWLKISTLENSSGFLNPEIQESLENYFLPYNQQLAQWLDQPLPWLNQGN